MPASSSSSPQAYPRGARLADGNKPEARLFHYPPDLYQPPHRHIEPHISVVLAGSLFEETDQGERMITHGATAVRAEGTRHAVRFGPAGAVVLTVKLECWPLPTCPREGSVFAPTAATAVDMLRRITAEGHLSQIPDDHFAPLYNRLDPVPERLREVAPDWLDAAARHLLATPGAKAVADLARDAGVHRAHFHRLFRLHYGLAPSVFRRRSMTAHALSRMLIGPESLAAAAAAAGFADQSHMARAVSESCGMTAGRIRRLLANATRPATSVQSGRSQTC